jgi:hypothetical protein
MKNYLRPLIASTILIIGATFFSCEETSTPAPSVQSCDLKTIVIDFGRGTQNISVVRNSQNQITSLESGQGPIVINYSTDRAVIDVDGTKETLFLQNGNWVKSVSETEEGNFDSTILFTETYTPSFTGKLLTRLHTEELREKIIRGVKTVVSLDTSITTFTYDAKENLATVTIVNDDETNSYNYSYSDSVSGVTTNGFIDRTFGEETLPFNLSLPIFLGKVKLFKSVPSRISVTGSASDYINMIGIKSDGNKNLSEVKFQGFGDFDYYDETYKFTYECK